MFKIYGVSIFNSFIRPYLGLDGTREYLTKVGANASGSPGMKHEITHYKNNKKYGFSGLYFTVDKNAVLEMRGCFVNDKKHGLCEVFHSNGKVQIRENLWKMYLTVYKKSSMMRVNLWKGLSI